jgi:hypothetical protein
LAIVVETVTGSTARDCMAGPNGPYAAAR